MAEAKHTFGGYAVAVIPTVTFLLALTLGERDSPRPTAGGPGSASRPGPAPRRWRRNPPPRRGRAAPSGGPRRGGASRRRARAEASRARAPARPAERSASRRSGHRLGRQRLASRLGRSAWRLRAVPPPEARANTADRIAMWAAWVHAIRAERRILHAAPSC